MSDAITRTYSNGEIEVIWRAGRCMHSTVCFRGLQQVFDPRRRPWVDLSGASTEAIVRQVQACPSGALSFVPVGEATPRETAPAVGVSVEPQPNGPLRVQGELEVRLADGSVTRRSGSTAFCRCGASSNKPFCDGSHSRVGFRG
jgi:uncharacterized Fe-S cluster protein YjdI